MLQHLNWSIASLSVRRINQRRSGSPRNAPGTVIIRRTPPPLRRPPASRNTQRASETSLAHTFHCAQARKAHRAAQALQRHRLCLWTRSVVMLVQKVKMTIFLGFQVLAVVLQSFPLLSGSLSGANLLENEAKSNSKPQRPTSLPIQPFVLVPAGHPEAPQVGCLLEQYMNQKSQRVSTSQPGFKFKGKRSRCFSSLQLSPMGSHYPVFLEPPSSSDSCSSSTPSPEWFGRRRTWSQSSRFPARLGPCTSKRSMETSHARGKPVQAPEDTSPHSEVHVTLTPPPNRPTLIKIPTYQDLNNLTPKPNYTGAFHGAHTHTSYPSLFSQTPPTLPISAPSHHSKPEQRPLLPPRAAPAADSGFFHGSFTAALSSMAPLPSLSSLLSFAASSHPSESLVLSDKLPADYCPSPDASYESLSISHLQRRGETTSRHPATAAAALRPRVGLSTHDDELLCSSAFNTLKGLPLKHDLFLTLAAWDWPRLLLGNCACVTAGADTERRCFIETPHHLVVRANWCVWKQIISGGDACSGETVGVMRLCRLHQHA